VRLLWLQGITCNGNSHSFFNHPQLFAILQPYTIVWHPLIEGTHTLSEVLHDDLSCDVLVLEGAFRTHGHTKEGVEVYARALFYARKARYVITAGTCASFGGLFAKYDPEHVRGFGFTNETLHLEEVAIRSRLITLSGCPIHPEWLGYVLRMIAEGRPIARDRLFRPRDLYAPTVHTGCVRNEYFEWKIDRYSWGEREGCMFYEQGCQGPYTRGSCNTIPWNEVSSKTTVGTPCFGCTEPDFPRAQLWETPTRMGIPVRVPLGISKRAYLSLTGVAKSFKIKRLHERMSDYDD